MKNAKKIIASLLVVAGFGAYTWHAKQEDAEAQKTVATTASNPSTDTTTSTNVASSTNSVTAASVAPTTYKDGTYTGTSADALYGYIQVKATITDGKLTNVTFLQYPNDQHESVHINTHAMPILKQEAIQAQTAQVDSVSGATDTSQAFIESLNAALNQAHS